MAYKKCPRCSLNYIKDIDLLCEICIKDVDRSLRNNGDDEEEYDICSECGESIIKAGKEMCHRCMIENIDLNEETDNTVKNDEWDTYLSTDLDDVIMEDDEDLDDPDMIDEEFEDEEIDKYERIRQ